jgi:hypothetical protein
VAEVRAINNSPLKYAALQVCDEISNGMGDMYLDLRHVAAVREAIARRLEKVAADGGKVTNG